MNIVCGNGELVVTGTGGGMKMTNGGGFEVTLNGTTSVGEIGKIVDSVRGIDCRGIDCTWDFSTGVGSGGTSSSAGSGGYYMSGKGLIKASEFNAVEVVDEMTELRLALEGQWQEYFDECVWKPDLSGFYEHLNAFEIAGNIVNKVIKESLECNCNMSEYNCKIVNSFSDVGSYSAIIYFVRQCKDCAIDYTGIINGIVKPTQCTITPRPYVDTVAFSFHMYDMLTDTEKELYVRNEKILKIRDKWFKKGVEKIGELVEWWKKEKVLRENECGGIRGWTVSLGTRVSKELYGDIVMEMDEEIDGIRENC